MIKLLLGVAALIILATIAVAKTKPRSYAVGALPLIRALLKLLRRGEGWVRVEGGDHFLQFCVVKDVDADILVVDMPVTQFVKIGKVPKVENLFALGFAARDTGPVNVFERRVRSAAEACAIAREVFEHIFGWPVDKQVQIVEG